MAFPGALPIAGTANSNDDLAAAGHTSLHNVDRNEIRAIATKMGIGASTPDANQVLHGTAAGTSAWGQVILTSEVSGVLPIANGGTGQSTQTGTGLPVAQTSPTIITPTIASFTNAQHGHTNAAGGGQLGTDALADAIITYAKLVSTIFSGQIVSDSNPGTAGGTRNLLNLGGVKICWGLTASCSALAASAATTGTVTLPTTYSAAPDVLASAGFHAVDGRVMVEPSAITTTVLTITYQGLANANNATAKASWITIGT